VVKSRPARFSAGKFEAKKGKMYAVLEGQKNYELTFSCPGLT
jgi:hypothetical protein